jgi:hypothetical protein
MSAFRRRLTYANVMSTIAVFGVLGGGAYAAGQIGSRDIQNNSIHSRDVKNQDLKGADIAPDSVSGDDIDESTLNVARTVQRTSANANAVLGGPQAPYPLAVSYTQGANETNQLIGSYTANFPPGCTGVGPSLAFMQVSDGPLKPDGSNVVASGVSFNPVDGTTTSSVSGLIPEPATGTPRNLQASVSGTCFNAGFSPSITSAKLAIVASR